MLELDELDELEELDELDDELLLEDGVVSVGVVAGSSLVSSFDSSSVSLEELDELDELDEDEPV